MTFEESEEIYIQAWHDHQSVLHAHDNVRAVYAVAAFQDLISNHKNHPDAARFLQAVDREAAKMNKTAHELTTAEINAAISRVMAQALDEDDMPPTVYFLARMVRIYEEDKQ